MREPLLASQWPPLASRLLRAANELSFARDVETITTIVRAAARELTGADGVAIILRENGYCHYVDEEAIAPLWKGQRFPLRSCVSGWVMEHGVPVVIPDVYLDHRVPVDVYRQTFVKSLAMVPVRPPESVAAIGAYWARTYQPARSELSALELLADSTALALANVELHQESRAALEREHQARAVAERAMSAKNDFLAVVAHELRQPLHACLAALRLIALESSSGDASRRAQSVVERQIQHMARLVEDLGNAAQVVRGDITLHRQPASLADIAAQASESVRSLMAERSHAFSVDVSAAPIVFADTARLLQVLLNLLGNAAKYTDPGGRITLRVGCEDERATISVVDNGRGIPPDLAPRIFDLFARATADASGFGIGLAVAHRLVVMHGGTISVRSEGTDRGSTFTVTLPVHQSPSE
ncbi:MAG: ATP-binding protein [Vicinamibacterales bacterium]